MALKFNNEERTLVDHIIDFFFKKGFSLGSDDIRKFN